MTMMKIDNHTIGSNFHWNGSFITIYVRMNRNGRINTDGRYERRRRARLGIEIRKRSARIFCSFNSKNASEYK
jgi:hypothetical protein